MKIGLVISIFFLLCIYGQAEELNQIRSYFGQLQFEFFVAIGQSSRLTSMIAHELKTWKGIYLLSDSQIVRQSLKNDNHNQFLHVKLPGSKSNAPILTLSEVCRSYFFKTPKLLVLTESSDYLSILNSNNWIDPRCSAEIIVIENKSNEYEVQKFLNSKGYYLLAHKDQIATYGLQKLQGIFNDRKVEFQVVTRFSSPPIFTLENHFDSIYKAILPPKQKTDDKKAQPSKIYFHQNRYRILSLPDLIEDSQHYANIPRPIVVLNFNGKEDYVYIDSFNFTVRDFKIDNLLFKKMQLTLPSGLQQIFILMRDGSRWLQMISENGNIFYQKDSQYNNILAYKNRCYEYQDFVQVVIRNKIQLHGIDTTVYEYLERPFKQKVRVTMKQQEIMIKDNENQKTIQVFQMIVALLILVAIALLIKKIYLSCKKIKSYQDISKDPTSSSLYNAGNATEENIP